MGQTEKTEKELIEDEIREHVKTCAQCSYYVFAECPEMEKILDRLDAKDPLGTKDDNGKL